MPNSKRFIRCSRRGYSLAWYKCQTLYAIKIMVAYGQLDFN